jgi:hypothetical protein
MKYPQKETLKVALSQASQSSELLDVLGWVCKDQFTKHIFTKGYREERAYADGQAEAYAFILTIIKGMTNDRTN